MTDTPSEQERQDRLEMILEMISLDMSYRAIAAHMGISYQRVEQIIHPDRRRARQERFRRARRGHQAP